MSAGVVWCVFEDGGDVTHLRNLRGGRPRRLRLIAKAPTFPELVTIVADATGELLAPEDANGLPFLSCGGEETWVVASGATVWEARKAVRVGCGWE